jgi:hypothetical protein
MLPDNCCLQPSLAERTKKFEKHARAISMVYRHDFPQLVENKPTGKYIADPVFTRIRPKKGMEIHPAGPLGLYRNPRPLPACYPWKSWHHYYSIILNRSLTIKSLTPSSSIIFFGRTTTRTSAINVCAKR